MGAGNEQVAIYDSSGRVVGTATRHEMRTEGLWHAATFVLVRSTDRRSVYVHRRTSTKDVYPGMHDCWAGGVVGAGEDPDRAAARELAEELGIMGAGCAPCSAWSINSARSGSTGSATKQIGMARSRTKSTRWPQAGG